MRNWKSIWIILFLLLGIQKGYSQNLDTILSNSLNSYFQNTSQEKLFIHTDKNFYLTGEMLWLKANLVDSKEHKPLDLSRLVYLEILNSKEELVFQSKLEMKEGEGNGSFQIPEELETGHYLFRAYTRWMQNFDPAFYFQKELLILNTLKASEPYIPKKPSYDIQFFPEGGNLVEGIESVVGIRVVNPQGKGVNYKGWILNEKRDTVARFSPLKLGLGHFSFMPLKEGKYQAYISIKGSNPFMVNLPRIEKNGLVVQVEEKSQINRRIKLFLSPNLGLEKVYAVCHTRGNLNWIQPIQIQENMGQYEFSNESLKDGISVITLFNSQLQPLAERLIFKYPQSIPLEAKGIASNYLKRSEVAFLIKSDSLFQLKSLKDLSISVYKEDSLDQGLGKTNILNYLFLESDIHGSIEDPGFYLQNTALAKECVNNLLLTQGWRRFEWKDVLRPKKQVLEFLPEINGPILEGKILHGKENLPWKNQLVYLSFPSAHFQFYSSITDSMGHFRFLIKNLNGSHEIVLSTESPDTNYHIELDPGFSSKIIPSLLESYNPDYSNFSKILDRKISVETQSVFKRNRLGLIKNIANNFIPFYGKPDYHYELSDYTQFPTLGEVITEYVRYISLSRSNGKYKALVSLPFFQKLYDHEPLYLLDGVPVFHLDSLVKIKAEKIKTIDLITSKYYYGPSIFDGILSFSTHQGDLNGYNLDPKSLLLSFEGTILDREFFSPIYSSFQEKESKIPDFRNTLYWNPMLKSNKEMFFPVKFFTGDISGLYRIEVNGINQEGIPLFHEFFFDIKP